MVTLRPCQDDGLRSLFGRHPHVRWGEGEPTVGHVAWSQDGWERRLFFDGSPAEVSGLIELADNNPLVCAGTASVPTALTTLGLIALGPLARAGLVAERPVLGSTFSGQAPEFDREMVAAGLAEPPLVQVDHLDLGSVLVVAALVEVPTLDDMGEIDALYEESYGRSFFVLEAAGEWSPEQVAGTPRAVYQLRQTPGEPTTLLNVQVMADRDGKCGAAQVVHTFNVMCGVEEFLGLV